MWYLIPIQSVISYCINGKSLDQCYFVTWTHFHLIIIIIVGFIIYWYTIIGYYYWALGSCLDLFTFILTNFRLMLLLWIGPILVQYVLFSDKSYLDPFWSNHNVEIVFIWCIPVHIAYLGSLQQDDAMSAYLIVSLANLLAPFFRYSFKSLFSVHLQAFQHILCH